MKRLLLLGLVSLCSFSFAIGQNIHFTDASNHWKVQTDGGGTEAYGYVFTYSYGADTVVGGQTYKQLVSTQIKAYSTLPQGAWPDPARFFRFREDTVLHRVYGLDLSNGVETKIYDAAWQVGDSIRIHSSAISGNPINLTTFVSAIDSTSISGSWHKVFHFRASYNGSNFFNIYSVIEGIGSTSGPWYPLYPQFGIELSWGLGCFQSAGVSPTVSPKVDGGVGSFNHGFDNASSCTGLAVRQQVLSTRSIALSPIPANSTTTLHSSTPITKGTLLITDGMGRTIYTTSIVNAVSIPVGRFISIPGQYFYRLTDAENNTSYTGKFMYE